jgi:hypothetical protein
MRCGRGLHQIDIVNPSQAGEQPLSRDNDRREDRLRLDCIVRIRDVSNYNLLGRFGTITKLSTVLTN